jgi:hypothetical protein
MLNKKEVGINFLNHLLVNFENNRIAREYHELNITIISALLDDLSESNLVVVNKLSKKKAIRKGQLDCSLKKDFDRLYVNHNNPLSKYYIAGYYAYKQMISNIYWQ